MSRSERSYRELARLSTFEERYDYLRLRGRVGDPTFGFDRWMNQQFYTSREWRAARKIVIVRDNGCDMGIPGQEIYKGLVIHHMNPMTIDDIKYGRDSIIDPDVLVTVSLDTHNAIHYGTENHASRQLIVRTAGDTRLW